MKNTRKPSINDQDTMPYVLKGIPCLIRVDHYLYEGPDYTTWESDWDFYGYEEIEYTLLDAKGYPAKWLQDKVQDKDDQDIKKCISKCCIMRKG